MEENSLEGKGEIMFENEEEYKELNVDSDEGSADKESMVSSFECVGPAISVQQDLGATSTAMAKKSNSKKADRIMKTGKGRARPRLV